jgi:hypothetical protein
LSFGLREKRGQWGPAGPKAEWAGKGGRAESEEQRFLNYKLDFEIYQGFGNLHKENKEEF